MGAFDRMKAAAGIATTASAVSSVSTMDGGGAFARMVQEAAKQTALATERADEADKMLVPSAYRQHQQALATERADEQDKLLVPSESRQAAQAQEGRHRPIAIDMPHDTMTQEEWDARQKDALTHPSATAGPVTDRASDRIALGQKTDDTLGQMETSLVSDVLSSAANLGGTLLHLGNRLNYSASSEKKKIDNAKKDIETYTQRRDAATTEEDRAYWQKLIDREEYRLKLAQELADFKGAPTMKGAQKLYETSDTLHEQAQQAAAAAKEGKGMIGKAAVDAGLMLGNIGAQVGMNALLPGSGTVMRTVDTAGRATREYRQGVQEEDEYSPVKAALRGATAAGSVLLGSVMSKAVGQTGEEILRSQGMDGEILPQLGIGAASGLGFAMGEIPLTEIGAALTDEHYSLEDREIGKRVASAVAFGTFDQFIKGLTQKFKASEYTVSEPQRKMKWFSEDMSPEEAAKLRRSLSRQYHPDVGGDAAVMQEINDEYSYFLQSVAGRASKAYAEAANAKAVGDAAAYNAASAQYRDAVGFLQDAVRDGVVTGDPANAVSILASVADSGIPSAVTTTAQPTASTFAPASIGAVGAQKTVSNEVVGMRLPTAEEKYGAADGPMAVSGTEPSDGQNMRLTENDLQEYMKTGDRKHVRDLKANIRDAGISPILTTASEIRRFMQQALHDGLRNTIRAYGKVGSRMSDAVAKATGGTANINGYYLELSANDVAHLRDHLGGDADPRSIPLTEEQILSIPDYIDSYDDLIEVTRRKDGSLKLMLGKKINGHSIIIETVSKGRHSLHPVTAWQIDSERYNRDYKTRAVDRSSTSRSENRTPVDISRPATALSDATISQPSNAVKPEESAPTSYADTFREMQQPDARQSTSYADELAHVNELLQNAALSPRDQAYIQTDIADAQKSCDAAMKAITNPNATSEERAQAVRRAIDALDYARQRINDLGLPATQLEVGMAQDVLADISGRLKAYLLE